MDFEHAYLLRDWLLEMMMSFTVEGIWFNCVVGIRCWKGGFQWICVKEECLYGRSIGDLAFCSREFSGYWIRKVSGRSTLTRGGVSLLLTL